jgi:hypothetical protein
MFTEPTRMDGGSSGAYSDGMQQIQQCMPVMIQLDPVIVNLLSKIIGKGILDKEITLIELGIEDDDEHSERFKAELKRVKLTQMGPGAVSVEYRKYETERYRKDDSTIDGGYDFDKQESLD